MRLYIIGNGFDRAHELKTSYWDFRCYLERYANEFLVEVEKIYGYYPYDPDDYHVPQSMQGDALKWHENMLYNILWKSFESSLGMPEESEFDIICDSAIDEMNKLESGPVGIEDTLNLYFEKQFGFVSELKDYLLKWAKQIRLAKAIVKKKEICNSTDLFLTFNYTATLERVYGIEPSNICHIHGGISPYCNTAPIIGHGNMDSICRWKQREKENDAVFDEGGASKCKAIANFYLRTLKNTDKILIANSAFFQKVIDVEEVIVIGHSFGDVDMPYFKEIVELSDKKIPWTIVYHSDSERVSIENKAKNLGLINITMVHSDNYWDN